MQGSRLMAGGGGGQVRADDVGEAVEHAQGQAPDHLVAELNARKGRGNATDGIVELGGGAGGEQVAQGEYQNTPPTYGVASAVQDRAAGADVVDEGRQREAVLMSGRTTRVSEVDRCGDRRRG
ncbi:MAG: hypothetical protein IPH23_14585 [Gammaproteobacteria bacterium]|nr:hypothetical protein [Gammaproteobacteria bacterium]